mmetsp:Transcript_18017/g.68316  ORF Transcript_18017/g.68316 Transcript_18017/m.68316 type:complete len:256 (-) Transcript_18017:516-1283(-)
MPQVPGSDRVANDVPDTVKVPRDDEDSSVGIERQGRGDAVKGGVAHAESAAGKLAQAGLVVPDRQPGRDPFTVDVIKLASEEEVSLHGIPGQRQDRRCCPVAHELPPLQRCPHLLICVEVSDVEDADELVAIPHARVERPAGEKIAILVDEQRLHRHARGERPSTQPAPHLGRSAKRPQVSTRRRGESPRSCQQGTPPSIELRLKVSRAAASPKAFFCPSEPRAVRANPSPLQMTPAAREVPSVIPGPDRRQIPA